MNIIKGDIREIAKTLPTESVDCIVTSPPYWAQRQYGDNPNEIGTERTFQEYVATMLGIFTELKRVLKKEGTAWVNLSDTYSGNKEGKTDKKVSDHIKDKMIGLKKESQSVVDKSLCNIPHRFAIALTDDGWIHRNTIVWYKKNCMPCSVTDRFTIDFEYIFFLTKSKNYYFQQQFEPFSQKSEVAYRVALRNNMVYNHKDPYKNNSPYFKQNKDDESTKIYLERGRNMRAVWDIPTQASNVSHAAMYPEKLVERMLLAGSPPGGTVLDPFAGSGTTLIVAKKLEMNYIGVDLYDENISIMKRRVFETPQPLGMFS